ncbi:hypothetical protein H1R20_g2879, partial [Candolleomyces eurysporus]
MDVDRPRKDGELRIKGQAAAAEKKKGRWEEEEKGESPY